MGSILKKIFERFIRIRGTPREIALGLALGLFIGFSPTMGLQIAIGVFFAALLKWSKVAAAIGVLVTNPFTAPFIYSFTYIIGARLLGLERIFTWNDAFDLEKIVDLMDKAPIVFLALTIGGIVVGIPAAVAGYFISRATVEKYQKSVQAKLQVQKNRIVNTIRRRRSRREIKKT